MNRLRQKAYNALRKSERFFKTDMVYLAKGGFWLNSGQIITSLASLGLAIIFAQLVPKEAYGNYRYILSLAGLASIFSLTGLSVGVVQSVARGFIGTFIKASKVLAKSNILIFVVTLAGSTYYLANGNSAVGYGLAIVAILYPPVRTFELYESFLSGKKNFRKSALYRGIADIGTILATAIAIFYSSNVIILIGANMAAQFVLNAFFFRKVYSSISSEDKNNIEPGIIEFSKHLSFQNILGNLAAHLDKIIIFHYLGATEVAIYTFAGAIPQQIKGFISNISLMITPKISQRSAREATSTIPKRFLISLTVLVPIVLLYIVLAPSIFNFLFPTYIESVIYTRWYALVLLVMGNLSSLVLTTQKATREQYILTTFSSTSQIIIMLILIHPFGIMGIIWAMLISKFSTSILSYIMVKRFVERT